MVKTVIFDLGRVIIPFDFDRGYAAMEKVCGVPAAEIPKRIGSTDLVKRFETGLVENDDFVRQISEMLGLKVSYPEFCELWSSIFLPDTLIPESLLAGLKKNYRLVLLSNTNGIHFDMVREKYPLLRHFDSYVLSHEVKAMKPAPAIYQAAIEQAQCAPGECFYIDDIEIYVEGGKKAGMDAVQFTGLEALEKEMRARGIVWEN